MWPFKSARAVLDEVLEHSTSIDTSKLDQMDCQVLEKTWKPVIIDLSKLDQMDWQALRNEALKIGEPACFWLESRHRANDNGAWAAYIQFGYTYTQKHDIAALSWIREAESSQYASTPEGALRLAILNAARFTAHQAAYKALTGGA